MLIGSLSNRKEDGGESRVSKKGNEFKTILKHLVYRVRASGLVMTGWAGVLKSFQQKERI